MNYYIIIGILVFVAVLFGKILKGIGHKEQYKRREGFLTNNELLFYRELCKVMKGCRTTIFAKVRLADIIEPKKKGKEWQTLFNKIQSKHVDFLICDDQSLTPKLVIELDDRSHDRADRQKRDAFVNQALAGAGIPIIHTRSSAGIKAQIESKIKLP